jgi:2-oxo-4-hydroxy-4-carboxy-5-ureidoimidazoline decarboxylase
MVTIEQVNETAHEQFMALMDGIFEHSPWIAEKAEGLKPFSSLSSLHREMVNIVESSSLEQKLALIQAHPNLGERVVMTTDSISEQTGAGLRDLTPEEVEKFILMNQQYMDKFGFPFIMVVRGKNKHQIYKAMQVRINHTQNIEFENALKEIYQIAWLRLKERLE